jgi:hypothetical protein
MGSQTLEGEVLERSGRRCCICFGLHGDFEVKRGQIAHLDHNHQNNNIDNLAFLCLAHHDEYDTRTSQSKGWTIEEAKYYRTKLFEEIEKRRNAITQGEDLAAQEYKGLVFSDLIISSPIFFDAVDQNTGQKYLGVDAFRPDSARFTFDVTNPNHFDVRILRLYVDVVKFISIDMVGIWEGGLGGGMTYRDFVCEVEPKVGSYICSQLSECFDYLKLTYGETEAFRIRVRAIAEGIYHLRLGAEFSIAGKSKRVELDDKVLRIGVFDPLFHEPSDDLSNRLVDSP